MTNYTSTELTAVLERTNIPHESDHSLVTFDGGDGWRIVVFYDAGGFDYIDHMIDPAGSVIAVWRDGENDPQPPASFLQNWFPPRKPIMSEPQIVKHWEDHCPRCQGRRRCDTLRLKGAPDRFDLLFPSRCTTKDKCEEEILRAAGIQPVRAADGSIVR